MSRVIQFGHQCTSVFTILELSTYKNVHSSHTHKISQTLLELGSDHLNMVSPNEIWEFFIKGQIFALVWPGF